MSFFRARMKWLLITRLAIKQGSTVFVIVRRYFSGKEQNLNEMWRGKICFKKNILVVQTDSRGGAEGVLSPGRFNLQSRVRCLSNNSLLSSRVGVGQGFKTTPPYKNPLNSSQIDELGN